jgi:hypothetical protein
MFVAWFFSATFCKVHKIAIPKGSNVVLEKFWTSTQSPRLEIYSFVDAQRFVIAHN